jgi:3-oxoacyl-[acyl-carrier-protein] synthase-1
MAGISITGIGSVTPVGLSAPASAAAFRARIARLSSLQARQDHGPEGPIPLRTGGRVPLEWFNGGPRVEEWPGHERFEVPIPAPEHLLIEEGAERLVKLAVPAALESLQQAIGAGSPPRDWGLFLGLAAEEDENTKVRLVEALKSGLKNFQPLVIEVLTEGHAAGLAALHKAAAAIVSGRISGAIVGGVDSLIRPATYERLSAAGVVKGPVNARGILPGEAAAFLVVEKQPRNGKNLAMLRNSSIADEPTVGTDKPNQAQGLTTVLRSIRTGASLAEMPLFICDMNGDRYRALEWGLALTRVFGNLHEKPETPTSGRFWHPADCAGDMGAASGIVDCIWAVEALRKGYALLNQVLVWGASETRLRAAVLISSSN